MEGFERQMDPVFQRLLEDEKNRQVKRK